MSVVITIDSTYVVSPDFTLSNIPEGYIWDETAFAELVKATDKATADESIYTYGGAQGDAETDYNNIGDLTISNQKYDGEGQTVDTTVTANTFNNTGTVTTEGAIAFSLQTFSNSGTFDLDKNGEVNATSAVTNMADGTINLNAGSTLQGSTVVNAGTITVVSDHATINGAITNHGTIDALMKKLIVTGDIQNANYDDTKNPRDNSIIIAREFEVTGNVVNYGIIGEVDREIHTFDVSGELSNGFQILVDILTADSIENESITSLDLEKSTRAYIVAGEVNAGSIDNVFGTIQTGEAKESGVGLNVTGTINNGNADNDSAEINAGLNGWIQAGSLNNIGTDYEKSLIETGKLTVGNIVNNGGISARIVESTGTITNNATGLFAVLYIDDPTITGLSEAASLTAGTIINGGTFYVSSEAALPTQVSVTSIENNGTFELSGAGMTWTGEVVNNADAVIDVAGTVSGTASITNSGTISIGNHDDISGALTAGAITNTATGTISLDDDSTLTGATVINGGTITVASGHAALNGTISNHSLIDSVMKTLNVTGDIQNANEDDMREARNSSIIKVRNLNVTGNVTNYGVIGTEWQEANDISISGDLRNFHQIIVNKTLTANSVYQDYIDSEVEEKRCVGYIICGQVIAGEINNASGEISAGADKDAGIAIEATGKITNGKADAIFSATLQAGDDGCIQAVDALNNIGAASTVHAGYITVLKGEEAGDLTNDGIIQTKSITVDGSVTNSATGSIEIDGASTESGNLSATDIGNAGTINLNNTVTLAGDVANSNLLNFQGTVTATGSITNAETGTINLKSAGSITDNGTITNSGELHIAIQSGKENKITADKFFNTEGVGKITIGGSFAGGVASVITAGEGDVKVSDITLSVTSADEKEVTAVTRGGNVAIVSDVDYSTIYLSNGIDEVAGFAKEVKDSTGASYYVDFTAFQLPTSALEDGVKDTTATILIDGTNAAALKYESETTASIDGLAFAKDGTNAVADDPETADIDESQPEKNVELVLTGMDPADPESYRDLKKGITVGAGVTLTADKLYQTGKDAVTNIGGELRAGTYNTGIADDPATADVDESVATGIVQVAAGLVNVNGGGAVNGVTVVSGGGMHVFSGGTATGNTFNNGGGMIVFSGGTATDNTVSVGGGIIVSGGTVNNTTVDAVGFVEVYSDGVANNTTVANSDRNGGMFVCSGGKANGVTVDFDGYLGVQTGASATDVLENGGCVYIEGEDEGTPTNVTFLSNSFSGLELNGTDATVHSGTTATDIDINSGGQMEIYSGGSLTNATVNAGGEMLIFSGAIVQQIRENGGYVETCDDATITFVSNTFSGLELNGTDATLHSGTTATDVSVNYECNLEVFDGGIADVVDVNADGRLLIHAGGKANGVTVNASGTAEVSSGVIEGAVVDAGGSLLVYSGAKLTGWMTFKNGAEVIPFVGSILDFDLTQTVAGADALVNDLSILMGKPSYTLTVDGSEEYGDYKLAEGASGFDRTITVVNISGEELGTLTVGGEGLEIDGKKYTLALDDSLLTLTVGDATPPNGPEEPFNNDLVYKNKTVNENVTEAYGTHLSAPEDEVRLDRIGTVDEEGKHNSLTKESDTVDYAKIVLEKGAKLSFHAEANAATTFTVYSLSENKGKYSLKKLQTLKLADKDGVFTADSAKPVDLQDAGEYYVSMQLAGKKADGALYNVSLSGADKTKFFLDDDNGENNWLYDSKKKEWNEKVTLSDSFDLNRFVTAVQIDTDPDTVISHKVGETTYTNFVGFGDAMDIRKVELFTAAKLSFDVDLVGGQGKLFLYAVDEKGKLKTVTNQAFKESGTTKKAVVLESGVYYLAMQSTNAKKGDEVYYNIAISDQSAFFTDGDTHVNNYDSKKKAVDPEVDTYTATLETGKTLQVDTVLPADSAIVIDYKGFTNFVGYGDESDMVKIDAAAGDSVSLKITAMDAVTLSVYGLKNGKVTALKSVKLKAAGDATLDYKFQEKDGTTFYVGVESPNAKKGGAAWYNVDVVSFAPAPAASLDFAAADALATPDALSFGSCGTDVLADASASTIAELDDKSSWQNLLA